MRKVHCMGAVMACAAILVSASAALAADNWLGTWKMNAAKSKFSPGPGPRSLTLKFEAAPAGIKFSSEGVDAEGKATKTGYVSRFDGQAVPYEGNPDADTAAPKKIDDNSYENTWTKGGKTTTNAKVVVSADGKTMTITHAGTNAKGQTVNHTFVYDRQ